MNEQKSRVAISKCADYNYSTVYAKVRETVELLGGMAVFVKPGEKVLLKPNLLAAKSPEKAITTHPLIVKAVVQLVKEAGGKPLIGDSPAIGNWEKIGEITGMKNIAHETDTPLLPFKKAVRVKENKGDLFKNLALAQKLQEADKVINLPKLKTHCQMFLTLAVKNLFGCVVGKKKAQWHLMAGRNPLYFARLLLEIYRQVKPCLTVVDGITGLEGNGPGSAGVPRQIGLILSGSDCVALDAFICEILGAEKEKLFTHKIAREMSIGETDFSALEILGAELNEVKIDKFVFPVLTDLEFGPSFLRKPLRNLFTTKPYPDKQKCDLCSACLKICPCGSISKEKNQLEFDYDRCIRCYCCLEVCPQGAIIPKQGWLAKILQD